MALTNQGRLERLQEKAKWIIAAVLADEKDPSEVTMSVIERAMARSGLGI